MTWYVLGLAVFYSAGLWWHRCDRRPRPAPARVQWRYDEEDTWRGGS